MMPTELSAVLPARHIQEECGVFGVYAPETASSMEGARKRSWTMM